MVTPAFEACAVSRSMARPILAASRAFHNTTTLRALAVCARRASAYAIHEIHRPRRPPANLAAAPIRALRTDFAACHVHSKARVT